MNGSKEVAYRVELAGFGCEKLGCRELGVLGDGESLNEPFSVLVF